MDMQSLMPYLAMMGLGGGIGQMGQGKDGGLAGGMPEILKMIMMANGMGGKPKGLESQLGSLGGMTANPIFNWMLGSR